MAFTTPAEVADRLGRALSATEQNQALSVLETVDGMIREAVGKGAAWVPDPVPAIFVELSLQKAIQALANPQSLASESLGSYSVTFPRTQDGGLALSATERAQVRRALYTSLLSLPTRNYPGDIPA